MAIREDLLARTTDEALAVLRLRDATAYNRMQNGIKTPGISICLGPGRCGFPVAGEDTRHCAFCLELGSNVRPKDVDGIMRKFVGGN